MRLLALILLLSAGLFHGDAEALSIGVGISMSEGTVSAGPAAAQFVFKNHAGSNTLTPFMVTANVDCTGANFMAVVITRFNGLGSLSAPNDNSGNSYTQVGIEKNSSTGTAVSLWRSFSAATSASFHWGEVANTANFATLSGACFTDGSPSSVDKTSSAAANQPGSVTPSVDNELLITGFVVHDPDSGTPTISAGFAITDAQPYSNGNFEGGGLAYQIQTTATPQNPTWSTTGGGVGAAIQASFK